MFAPHRSVLLFPLLLLACGGRMDGSPDNIDASRGTGGTGGATSVGGTTGVADATAEYWGYIEVESVVPSGPDSNVYLIAGFRSGAEQSVCSPVFANADCTVTPINTFCSSPIIPQPSQPLTAGDLSVTSPNSSVNGTGISPVGNLYDAQFDDNLVGGETFHIVASGGTVPAFAIDLSAPRNLLLDSPAAPDGVIAATTTADLVLNFTQGVPGVEVTAIGFSANSHLDCRMPSETGILTIPAAALAALGAGNRIDFFTNKSTMVLVGNTSIDAGVLMGFFTPDKLHHVRVELQ